jgi:hypothetical protein
MPRSKPFTRKIYQARQKERVKKIYALPFKEKEALEILEGLEIDKAHLKGFMKALFGANAIYIATHDKRHGPDPIVGIIQPSPGEMKATLKPFLKSIKEMTGIYAACSPLTFSKVKVDIDEQEISVDEVMKTVSALQSAIQSAMDSQKSKPGNLDKNRGAKIEAALKLIDFLRLLPPRVRKRITVQDMFIYLEWCFDLLGIKCSGWSFRTYHHWYPKNEKISASLILRDFFLKK